MSTPDDAPQQTSDESTGLDVEPTTPPDGDSETPAVKLDLNVEITDVGPCKKHLKVEIPQADVERQFSESLGSMRREAIVPGFRPGRAPATLVQRRFRKEVQGQVKSALLLAALEQLDEEHKLNPISQPDLDIEAIELPEEGPLQFEMEVEVQPDFELPEYKTLTVKRPARTVTESDVETQLRLFLERYAQEVPKLEGGAELGDIVVANLTFDKDGIRLNEVKEARFRLQPELRFQDGHIPGLDAALLGAKVGEFREAEAKIGSASPDPALRGQTVRVTLEILDLKMYRLPELDQSFLSSIGFESENELREILRSLVERRFAYQQREAVRRSLLDQLRAQTPFDLPADLVSRQEKSVLRNRVLELRESGLSDAQIRAREAEIRANAHEATEQMLQEFFILSRIADVEEVKVEDEDIELEIMAIAARTDESPRRVRSRLEKEGLLESLATQLLERKTIDRILEYATIEDVSLDREEPGVETIEQSATPEGPESHNDPEAVTGDEDAPTA